MNIKIFCRRNLFPSWSGYGLICSKTDGTGGRAVQGADLSLSFARIAGMILAEVIYVLLLCLLCVLYIAASAIG